MMSNINNEKEDSGLDSIVDKLNKERFLMKCKMKIVGLVVALAIVLSITAFATVGSRTAELWYNNIKIMINGKEVTPTDANGNAIEPFTIDGTTYLPVRGIASALGMNVGWDGTTSTVTLDNPGVFQGGVQVYDDKYVTIEFAGCTADKPYEWSSVEYNANFNITNKTDATLTFQPKAIALDGISYQLGGSEEVAPQSTGKVSFYSHDDALPVGGVSKISGQVRVIDFDEMLNNVFKDGYAYDVKWVNVTQK